MSYSSSPSVILTIILLQLLLPTPTHSTATVNHFQQCCTRTLPTPLTRFYGSRPHPDLSMVARNALWSIHDKNLNILPTPWKPLNKSSPYTLPFVDTHVAVRFLGGVSPFPVATTKDCKDTISKNIWCDLITRNTTTHQLNNIRFDLIHSRLDRYVYAGMDLMLVLDNVPYAFVSNHSQTCQNFGCQYLPPNNATEFALFISNMAVHLVESYGLNYVTNHIRWRLGTEANGPRWGGFGVYFKQYWENYIQIANALQKIIPSVQIGASNWSPVGSDCSKRGNFTPSGGSDSFQYQFYNNFRTNNKAAVVPLDFISISHYGTGRKHHTDSRTGFVNFPFPDFVQRTPDSSTTANEVELHAMQELAQRASSTLEVQEWSILTNENGMPTFEPSSVGSAWTTASATTWMCYGAEKIFHWETGNTIRNTSSQSGDHRLVNFFEQFPWSMAFLELFLGGTAHFKTFQRTSSHSSAGCTKTYGLDVVTVLESEHHEHRQYLSMVASVAAKGRSDHFQTNIILSTEMFVNLKKNESISVKQWVMNSSSSVTEQILRDLGGQSEQMLQHDDGLPYAFNDLLTASGKEYVVNHLDTYWNMHKESFQPKAFEGVVSWNNNIMKNEHLLVLCMNVTAPSVVVVVAEVVES